jgi:hypothetical protein
MKISLQGSAVVLAATLLCACDHDSAGGSSSTFDSPGAAAVAFSEAVRSGNREALTAMLGPESAPLLNTGDTIQGGNERKAFVLAYDSQRVLVPGGQDTYFLEVGAGRWPLPLPIVKNGDAWKFDTNTGIRELVLRRVGRNELAVLSVCRGIIAAQKEYAAKFGGFATKLRSEPGKQDGLYWEAKEGEPQSPAGALLAQAEAQGYTPGGAQPQPYRGYIYRRLEVKDPTKEFAILAYPANYGSSGIMTFIVDQEGAIYHKNLGVDTGKAVESITSFAPDDTWTRET